MLESPVIQELLSANTRTTAQGDILTVLKARFGQSPEDLATQIRSIADEDRLSDLVAKAASCRDLEAFRKELTTDN